MKFGCTLFRLCWLIFLLWGCRTSTQEGLDKKIVLLGSEALIFLDSLGASEAIVRDEIEGFFEQVGVTDMLIQMKRPFVDSLDRGILLAEYKAYLKTEVTDFTKEEKEICQDVLSRIEVSLNRINPGLFPKPLRLIKSHGNHYGFGAYYTREDAIIIPKKMLKFAGEAEFYETMLHEIFHIYSRYHPAERAALYELIGFKSIGRPGDLQMDPVLRDRLLLNPDGVNCAYAIRLEEEGREVFAIPLIVAKARGYEQGRVNFFDYLQFGLYPVRAPYSRLVKVESEEDGDSRLVVDEVGLFYEQIQRNTGYIIHPDEILGDNFVFMVLAEENGRIFKQFDEGGVGLIKGMREIFGDAGGF